MECRERGPFDFDDSQEDQQRQAMKQLIAQLNAEEETDTGVLPPKAIEKLNWSALATKGELGARLVLHMKRLVLELQPKSLRQQIYMICEVIEEDDKISLKSRWTIILLLLCLPVSSTLRAPLRLRIALTVYLMVIISGKVFLWLRMIFSCW